MKKIKRFIKVTFVILLLIGLVIVGCNLVVIVPTKSRIHTNLEAFDSTNVALILGTSKYRRGGGRNLYFHERIQAASMLYKAGKVKRIVVSGDNRRISYNEPMDMRNALVALGVPKQDIVLDYAGFRTLDSVVRLKHVFGQSKAIIVTQRFHAYRALFLCDSFSVSATAYAANDPQYSKFNIIMRELLARIKALLDVYVLNTQPKFLGDPVSIAFLDPV